MTKYAKYASWLAKAIIAVAAVANFVMYLKTLENVYSAMFGSSVALLLALDAMDELLKLKKRIGFIENRQSLIENRQLLIENRNDDFVSAKWFLEFEKDVYNRLNDCKKCVDNLTKTINGDE